MIRKVYISIVFVLCAAMATGQLTNAYKAFKAFQADDNELARKYIDSAIVTPSEMDDSETWLLRGHIYYETYAKVDKQAVDSKAREASLTSFKKAMELDTDKSHDDKIKQGLFNIAASYYNDAVSSMNDKSYKNALPSYEKYKELIHLSRPETNLLAKDIEFYNALGALLHTVYKHNKEEKAHLWQESIDAYTKTFALDTADKSANYNLAILYYNKGVDLILSLPPDAGLEEIFKMQEQTVKLFLKARPYMRRAHKLDPTNLEVITGMQGISYELNDKPEIEYWDNVYKKLKGEDPDNDGDGGGK